MNVGIFYNSISTPAKYPNKVMLMDNFRAGVLANGDKVTEFKGKSLPTRKLDVGFVLGYTLEDNFRKQIINTLRSYNTPQVFVDSNILHYARPEHEWHRYRNPRTQRAAPTSLPAGAGRRMPLNCWPPRGAIPTPPSVNWDRNWAA